MKEFESDDFSCKVISYNKIFIFFYWKNGLMLHFASKNNGWTLLMLLLLAMEAGYKMCVLKIAALSY